MMSREQSINTIAEPCSAVIVVKNSKFIAHAAAAENRVQAESCITGIAKRYHDASHNCFAYKVGVGEQALLRFSDDGEPSGTAGRPILQAITSRELTNIAVVVTRYFGGTKLGTGGLIRAYRDAAVAVLDSAGMKTCYPASHLRLTFAYEHSNTVHWLVDRFQAGIVEKSGSAKQCYLIRIRTSRTAEFSRELQDQLKGNLEIAFVGQNADH